MASIDIIEPKVYLVGYTKPNFKAIKTFMSETFNRTFVVDNGDPKYKNDTLQDITYIGNNSELIPTLAGKICYNSFAKKDVNMKEYLQTQIIEKCHGSVLEHVSFNFLITNVSRKFTHEHVRHRIASISQRSQRYVDESKCNFVVPAAIRKNIEAYNIWKLAVEQSRTEYSRLINALEKDFAESNSDVDKTVVRKIVRSSARSVLPSSTETMLMWTINARSLRNYLELRCSEFAEDEIKKVANQIFILAKEAFPAGFEDYEISYTDKDSFVINTKNRRI